MKLRGSSRLFSGLLAVCLGIWLSLGATPAWSQATSSSTVTGLVTDQQNAAVPGVEVRLVDVATKTTRTTLTNDTGRYIFVDVPSGIYDVSFSKTGFSQSRAVGQEAVVGSTLTINTTLEVGATTTTVEVTASKAPTLLRPTHRWGRPLPETPSSPCRTWAAMSPPWRCCSRV